MSSLTCFACGQPGHTSRECPSRGPGRGGGGKGRGRGGSFRGSFRGRGGPSSFGSSSMFRKRRGGGGSASDSGSGNGFKQQQQQQQTRSGATSLEAMKESCDEEDRIDAEFGFARIVEGPPQLGWLTNMQQTLVADPETGVLRSAIDYYFIRDDLTAFKVAIPFLPYIFLQVAPSRYKDVEVDLRKTYDKLIHEIEPVTKEDLSLKNHLAGVRATFMKVSFLTVQALMSVRSDILPAVTRNRERSAAVRAYDSAAAQQQQQRDSSRDTGAVAGQFLSLIDDIREYDVPYFIRASIDKEVRVANWYRVEFDAGHITMRVDEELSTRRPHPHVLAFDIETTKQPLKFPDPASDVVMMISYMCDRRGYLIVNRDVVSEDTADFEYTPKPEFPGNFTVFNVPDEAALLQKFFSHAKELRPQLYVTFNGDFFDWPFIEARARAHGMSMAKEIGVRPSQKKDCYSCRYAPHLDCFCWVQRDSYLPHGSQGLKAVTKAKLGYDPLELDPEDMVRLAKEQPRKLTDYSVSDAVATYYLYSQHIHPFIFSLCTIIPMGPEDVLRKGTGTLCENLLMVEAFRANVIFPNKVMAQRGKLYKGHLLDEETYVGGHVESLESGVFRNDIPMKFKLDSKAFTEILNDVDGIVEFAAHEAKTSMDRVTNAEQIKSDIRKQLESLRDVGLGQDGYARREEKPLIVHLDVAAMYPNIILTNRLQPCSIVSAEACAACVFNRPENKCKRPMKWVWRGDYIPTNKSEYELIKAQIESEKVTHDGRTVPFTDLPESQQAEKLMARLKDYSRKVYKKAHVTEEIEREDVVCQRENSFYVDMVRAFRDRRYTYKDLLKVWKGNLDVASKAGNQEKKEEAEKMLVMYDSLQLAHKCILNSFYGYVMRKGSRWMSMQMAGIVTNTGLNIITRTRELVQRIGRPVELDTDGIWCALPASFPFNYKFALDNGKAVPFSFPCVMLNRYVALNFSNHQYQTLQPDGSYKTKSECSIAFELDGPYKAILLPAAKEKDKKLKKRYAVFHLNGSLAELKGFEIKRRGELKLIKIFQSDVFSQFLNGGTLQECYASVATIADRWLDVLQQRGRNMDDEELLDLLTETSNMSKKLESYGTSKTTQVTTARRLSEFLGSQILKSEGLKCAYVVANKPCGAMVTERAIPTAIFLTDDKTRRRYLTKWLGFNGSDEEFALREILDWDYYWKRLESCIQKIVTIPAGLQEVPNPVPRVKHPDWLEKQMKGNKDGKKQLKIDSMLADIEDIVPPPPASGGDGVDGDSEKKRELDEKHAADASDADGAVPKAKKRKTNGEAKQTRLDGVLVPAKDLPSGRVDVFFRRRALDFACKPWQIIRVAQTPASGNPGDLALWVLVDGVVQSVTLTVKRRFYVNFTRPQPKQQGRTAVAMTPPRSKPAMSMYEYTMTEAEFLAKQRDLSELSTQPDVEGIYETHVPPLLRALVSLGCVCKARQSNTGQTERWDMDTLEFVNATTVPYLAQPLRRVFLYHSLCSRGGDKVVGVIGVYFAHEKKAYVTVINPFPGARVPPVGKIVTGDLDVRVTLSQGLQQAYRDTDSMLSAFHSEGHASYLLVPQTSLTDRQLAESIPATSLYAQVPRAFNRADNRYAAFGWEAEATRRMHVQYSHLEEWFNAQLALARYAHVPVGNVLEDAAVSLSDVMFARSLQQSRMLLWMSPSGSNRPDLGGSEDDDNQLSSAGEEPNPEVCEPGCYRDVCVELDMKELAFNAIVKAEAIMESEGGASMFVFADNAMTTAAVLDEDINRTLQIVRSFDGTIEGSRPFKAMKKLVHSWTNDTTSAKSGRAARFFLSHLFRWLSCPYSRLHEPAVHKVVVGLMRKLFFQLLYEVRRLGAQVVYASFHKLILSTGKSDVTDAANFVAFLQKQLEANQLFGSIALVPRGFWDVLLFMDPHNYGGIPGKRQRDTTPLDGYADDDDGDGAADELISNWNIAEFIPKSFEPHFQVVLSEFLLRVAKKKRAVGASGAVAAAMVAAEHLTSEEQGVTGANVPMHEYIAGDPKDGDDEDDDPSDPLISSEFHQQLFTVVKDIQKNASHDELSERGVAASNPALTFTNYICHVLRLDKRSASSIDRLKKSLLRLIGVGEYSPDAEFRNPCVSYALPDVICSFCNSCKDLDLLRDPNLSKRNWTCTSCGQLYSKLAVESALVHKLLARSMAFQVQDLVCGKCREVKADNSVGTCKSCSSTPVLCKDEGPDSIARLMSAFATIAEFHEFTWLAEVVKSMQLPSKSKQT